jgi:30S ribosomal protein S31
MGRGDIKTKKGKIFAGSFGKVRPAKAAKKVVAVAGVAETKKPAKKKA